jgi:hypothetical protein
MGENFVQDHPNCTFEELEQTFCKRFRILKNNEEVYMQFQNIQQQTTKCVEVYYEHLLKLANYQHVPQMLYSPLFSKHVYYLTLD